MRSGRARFRRTISSTRMAASCRWCARATAPGMPGKSSWRGRDRHQFAARSASRSSMRAMPTAIPNFPRPADRGGDRTVPRHRRAPFAFRPERVLAHSDVAPGRKIDPGEKFPWRSSVAAGVGHYVAPAPISGGARACGRRQGRGGRGTAVDAGALWLWRRDTGVFDRQTSAWSSAFQRHFRPRAGRRRGRPLDGRDAAPAARRPAGGAV